MSAISIELTFECSVCGSELEVHSDGNDTISIEPCEECFEEKYEEGFDDGKEEGYSDGFDEGVAEGESK